MRFFMTLDGPYEIVLVPLFLHPALFRTRKGPNKIVHVWHFLHSGLRLARPVQLGWKWSQTDRCHLYFCMRNTGGNRTMVAATGTNSAKKSQLCGQFLHIIASLERQNFWTRSRTISSYTSFERGWDALHSGWPQCLRVLGLSLAYFISACHFAKALQMSVLS